MNYENEGQIRKDFARIFDWRKEGPYYEKDYRTPEWVEIFVEVGRLYNRNKLESLSLRIDQLEEKVFKVTP